LAGFSVQLAPQGIAYYVYSSLTLFARSGERVDKRSDVGVSQIGDLKYCKPPTKNCQLNYYLGNKNTYRNA